MLAFDRIPFERLLAETIAWCAPRARADDPEHSLRSDVLRPSLLARDRAHTVERLAIERARHVRTIQFSKVPASLHGGRLLVYFPDANLADGAAEVESRGFFDVDNVPPWDTWIALLEDPHKELSYRQYVVAWVPVELIACASSGIAVNPEECIGWLDEVDVAAHDEIQRLLAR